MVKVKTVQGVAQEIMDNMKWRERTNGDKYVVNLIDIKWQKDIIRKAHGDKLPDDYVYAFIYEALTAIIEGNEGEEDEAIYAIEPDIYTSELTAWLHSRNDRAAYLDEAIAQGATTGDTLLSYAQAQEKQEVAQAVLQGIREYINE